MAQLRNSTFRTSGIEQSPQLCKKHHLSANHSLIRQSLDVSTKNPQKLVYTYTPTWQTAAVPFDKKTRQRSWATVCPKHQIYGTDSPQRCGGTRRHSRQKTSKTTWFPEFPLVFSGKALSSPLNRSNFDWIPVALPFTVPTAKPKSEIPARDFKTVSCPLQTQSWRACLIPWHSHSYQFPWWTSLVWPSELNEYLLWYVVVYGYIPWSMSLWCWSQQRHHHFFGPIWIWICWRMA